MKLKKEQLVEIISEEIEQVIDEVGRGIPVGGGEALTCAEAGAKAGAAYAKAKPDIAKSIVRVSVQQKGAKKQISGKHSAMLDNAAKAAMKAQKRLSCQEGPEGMRAMDAFRDAFLKVANEEHAMGFASASGPTSGAQRKRSRKERGYDHIGDLAAESLTKSKRTKQMKVTKEQLVEIISEEIKKALNLNELDTSGGEMVFWRDPIDPTGKIWKDFQENPEKYFNPGDDGEDEYEAGPKSKWAADDSEKPLAPMAPRRCWTEAGEVTGEDDPLADRSEELPACADFFDIVKWSEIRFSEKFKAMDDAKQDRISDKLKSKLLTGYGEDFVDKLNAISAQREDSYEDYGDEGEEGDHYFDKRKAQAARRGPDTDDRKETDDFL